VLTWISGDGSLEVTSSRGRSLALGDRLAVSLAIAKRLPCAKDSLLSPDARTSKAFSDGHMLLSIDSYGISKLPREGEKNHKKGGLNCVFGIFYVLDNCPQVQSLK